MINDQTANSWRSVVLLDVKQEEAKRRENKSYFRQV